MENLSMTGGLVVSPPVQKYGHSIVVSRMSRLLTVGQHKIEIGRHILHRPTLLCYRLD
jgi:hypothetical protein